MWCGSGLWPGLVPLVSISKAVVIQETTGGGVAHCAVVDNEGCEEVEKGNCSGAARFC